MEHLPHDNKEITARHTSPGFVPASYAVAAESVQRDPAEPERGGLLDYWLSLRRHKGTLILFTFCGLAVAAVITMRQTPVYQARTSIEVQNMNLDFLGPRPVNPVGDDNNYAALADIPTQIRLLQSESLAAQVMQKLKVSRKPGAETAKPDSGWRAALHLPTAQGAKANSDSQSTPLAVRIRAAGQTRIIEVLCDSTNPEFAAEYVNALASEFIDSNVEARWKMSQRTGDWLTRQLDTLRIKLEHSEDSLQEYARRSNLMFTGEKNSVSEEKLRQLQTELSRAQGERVAAQSRYEMLKSTSPDALPEVLGDTSLQEIETKLTELRATEAELLITFKPKHEKVQRIQAQIAPLQAALQSQRAAILGRIRNEFETAQRREQLLATEYANQSRLVTTDAEKSIQYGILKREVDSSRQLYDAMLQKVKETSVTSAMRASNIRVVDPGQVPKSPYKPDFTQNAGIGSLAGLLIGISFVLMRERADHTLQEPGDAQFWLNIPELGIIPRAIVGVTQRVYYGKRQLLGETSNGDGATGSVELITWQNKPSMLAESFRSALVSILFSGENGSRPRVMVITSSGPGEGKSTVVSNLAIAVAEVNQKILVIDADLRKPRMHTIFNLNNERGLGDLLRSKAPVASALEGLIQESGVPDLYVLTSGPSTSAGTSLLYSSRMPEVLKTLRTQFETILIDTPPMLQIPDARVLGRMVDRVIMVVRAGKTTRDAAMAARQRFSEDGTPVLGTILNDWDPKWSPGGYYGYDNHYYKGHYGGHGYGAKNGKPSDE